MSVERCVLCGPKRSSIDNVSHFNFPPDKWREWESFCEQANPDKLVFPSSKLCCIHFTEESFSSVKGRHNLEKGAVPSLFAKHDPNISRKCNHQRTTVRRRYYSGLHKSRDYCSLCKVTGVGIAHFKFPKNDNIGKLWADFCQIDTTNIRARSKLCQYHFTDSDFNVTNSGRVTLKTGTIPSIRSVNRKTRQDTHDERRLELNTTFAENVAESSTSNIRIMSNEDNNIGDDLIDHGTPSTIKMLKHSACSFCKNISSDVVPFKFADNMSMRQLLTKSGMSPSFLDEIHIVCASHFDADHIDLDTYGKKMVKERAFPWSYIAPLIINSITPQSYAAASIETLTTAMEYTETDVHTPVIMRTQKLYVDDLTPSDFKSPRMVRRSLAFIKDKFGNIAIKTKRIQDRNRLLNNRLKKSSDIVRNFEEKNPD